MHAGYGRLVALAEQELALVRAGTVDELAALWELRREVVASLPPVPPPDARPTLERAAELQGLTTALLEEHVEATGADMRRLVIGRAAMNTYARPTSRTPLVDRAG